MKGFPPFQGEPGKPPPPSADPLRLIQFALQAGYPIQIINFGGAVKEVQFRRKAPPSGSCFHRETGEVDLVGALCDCGQPHSARERCATCGEMVPYHDFPGRELRVAELTVEAPAGVGRILEGPPAEQDYLILIHIPRVAGDAMDSPIERPRVILPPGVH